MTRCDDFWSPFPTATRTRCERCGVLYENHVRVVTAVLEAVVADPAEADQATARALDTIARYRDRAVAPESESEKRAAWGDR